jgi:hypothetical protein
MARAQLRLAHVNSSWVGGCPVADPLKGLLRVGAPLITYCAQSTFYFAVPQVKKLEELDLLPQACAKDAQCP